MKLKLKFNGELPVNTMEQIELPEDLVSNNNLIDEVFRNSIAGENFKRIKILKKSTMILWLNFPKSTKSTIESIKSNLIIQYF